MAVPRNRVSNSRKNTRRAHDAKKPKNLSHCPECNSLRMPHTVCLRCGSYSGQKVISSKESE